MVILLGLVGYILCVNIRAAQTVSLTASDCSRQGQSGVRIELADLLIGWQFWGGIFFLIEKKRINMQWEILCAAGSVTLLSLNLWQVVLHNRLGCAP